MTGYTIVPNKDFLQTVKPVIDEAIGECQEALPIDSEITINVGWTDDDFIIERMKGSTGWVVDRRYMAVLCNTGAIDWETGLKGSVAHEYNHLARLEATDQEWWTADLREQVVLDGLAQCFEEEIVGEAGEHAHAIDEKQAIDVWERMKPRLDEDADGLFEDIFFGESDEFPHWAGYTVSYLIIKNRLAELDADWPEIMKMSSEELVEPYWE